MVVSPAALIGARNSACDLFDIAVAGIVFAAFDRFSIAVRWLPISARWTLGC
jgi:hypothetical protein